MKNAFLLPLLLVVNTSVFTQGFIDVTSSNGIVVNTTGNPLFGHGCSFHDFNRDGLDDITYTVNADSIIFYLNTGTGFQRLELIDNDFDAKHPLWVDYDNDGDSDLLVSARNNGTRLYRQDAPLVFTDVTAALGLPGLSGTNVYGCSWGDYNRDGWLDLYVSTLNTNNGITNYLCKSNGDGTFTEVAASAGVADGLKETFQSTWVDFNQDGWLDLFVINENDVSAMYYNNGDETFTDVSADTGTNINIFAMSNSVSDFDHDGDFDIYVSNNQDGNYLLRNDNGVFTNVAGEAGVSVLSYCWGALWVDYDHNTWEDLHVTTALQVPFPILQNGDLFFTNDGDGTFSSAGFTEFTSDWNRTFSTSKGDFNNDGFWDFTVTKIGAPYQLFQGIPTTNNWVKTSFEGVHSNRDAIGTFVEYFANGQKQIRITQSGESFMGQDSQYEILSLGSASQIDSLRITWPRGLVEMYYNLAANQTLHFVEGSNTSIAIQAEEGSIICGTEPVVLDAGEFLEYEWNDGSTERYLSATEAGTYSVTVTDSNDYVFSANIALTAVENPEIVISLSQPLCPSDLNGSISISASNAVLNEILWEDGTQGAVRESLGNGTYAYTTTDANGCTAEGTVELTDPLPLSAELVLTSVSCAGFLDGSAELENVQGGTGEISVSWLPASNTQLAAGTYEVVLTDENNCSLSLPFTITQPEEITLNVSWTDAFNGNNGSASAEATGGTEPYTFYWSNGTIDPDAENLGAGVYTITVTDANNCSIDTSIPIIDLSVGETETSSLKVFPNPGNQWLNIVSPPSFISETVEIRSMVGQVVLSRPTISQGTHNIAVGDLPNGIYIISLRGDKGTIFTTWVAER